MGMVLAVMASPAEAKWNVSMRSGNATAGRSGVMWTDVERAPINHPQARYSESNAVTGGTGRTTLSEWHCHVNGLPRDQATLSSTQTWFLCLSGVGE